MINLEKMKQEKSHPPFLRRPAPGSYSPPPHIFNFSDTPTPSGGGNQNLLLLSFKKEGDPRTMKI